MAALFLAPFYLIFNGYVLHWLFCWADACCRSFRPVSLRFPAAVLYWFLALSPLTGLLITVDPWHRFLKIIGNYWLGTFAFILSVVLVLDGLRRLTGLSVFKNPFLLRPYGTHPESCFSQVLSQFPWSAHSVSTAFSMPESCISGNTGFPSKKAVLRIT